MSALATGTDVIDALSGVTAGSALDGLRRGRLQARDQSQAAYDALFIGPFAAEPNLAERLAVATFVAGISADPIALDHYRGLLAGVDADLAGRVSRLAGQAATSGPYGRYPASTDLDEDVAGLVFTLDADAAAALGVRLAAALEHAHLLVFRPREASPDALARLAEAGWSTAGIVTLSQLVAFLAFQLKVAAGLRVLVGGAR